LADGLGADSVAMLSAGSDRDWRILADSDDDRSAEALAALLNASAIRDALSASDVVVADRAGKKIAADGGSPEGGGAPVAGGETWAIFPIVVSRRARGVVVAFFAGSHRELADEVLLAGRAAAALLAVALPAVTSAAGSGERTRKVTLTDVHRERRMRAIERYRAFIDSASDGIVVLDEAGIVLY